MKIIAIIEDTGERRVPKEGETFTLEHNIDRGDVSRSVYTHKPTEVRDYAIIRVTEPVPEEIALTLQERVELINLRRFRDIVLGAESMYSRNRADNPEALLDEVRQLQRRLSRAADSLRGAHRAMDSEVPSNLIAQAMVGAATQTGSVADLLAQVETTESLIIDEVHRRYHASDALRRANGAVHSTLPGEAPIETVGTFGGQALKTLEPEDVPA